ncbi:MAG: hypothetical protein AAGA08_16815 [Pseudomonadota bacterium]
MSAIFFPAFNFIANNKYAQIALTFGAILIVWRLNNRQQRRVGAKEARQENRVRALEQDREIMENSREMEDMADRVRDATAERLRDDEPLPDYHFRDE